MHKKQILFFIILTLCFLCYSQTKEEQNIAHDILLFSTEIKWPQEYKNEDSIIVGVLDRDKRLSGYIEYKLRNKIINGKPVKVKSFLDANSVTYSHILIVSRARNRKIDNVFEKINFYGTLIISDHGKDEKYLMIDYTNAKRREFDIYPENISRAGLKMSRELVQYAQKKISIQELYFLSEKSLSEKQFELFEQSSELNAQIEELDSLYSEIVQKNNILEIQEQNLTLQTEKIERETNRLNILKGELHTQRLLLLLSIITGILLLGVLFLLAYNFRIKKNANKILTLKNAAITRQKTELEYKSKLITDSINYASRIQSAILIPEKELTQAFTRTFIFYYPRDIVSGDFYWYSKINNGHIIASIDCTGHGVPGALMSMIGNTLMNQIVKEKNIKDPAEILTALHYGIIESLHQEKKEIYAQDGMDAAVLFVSEDKKTGLFCGANQSIYQVKENQLKSYDGHFITLGGVSKFVQKNESQLNLESQKIHLEKSMVYMFSDGYIDQFGGPRNKKFNISRFKSKMIEIAGLSVEKQRDELQKSFLEWKGEEMQIDDLMVIGLKF